MTEGIGAAAIGEAAMSAEAFTLLGRRVTISALTKYFAEAGVFTAKGLLAKSDGKNLSGDIDIAFGVLLPIIHEFGIINRMNIGKVTKESVDELAQKIIGKNETELLDLFGRAEAQGGLSDAAKELFVKASNCSRKVWTETSKEAIKMAANILKSKGLNIQSSLSDFLMKVGDGIHKKWLLRFSFVLLHDITLLESLKKLLTVSGQKDRKEIFNLAVLNYEKALLEGKENEYLNNVEEIVNNSKDTTKTLENAKQIFEIKEVKGNPPISDELMIKMQDSIKNLK
jgi:hypothetical protein